MDPKTYVRQLKNNKDKTGYENYMKDRLKFTPNDIPYNKYFPDGQMQNILVDFEDHVACARFGGTNSLAREKEDQQKEDIRAPVVQNVSINTIINSNFSFLFSS